MLDQYNLVAQMCPELIFLGAVKSSKMCFRPIFYRLDVKFCSWILNHIDFWSRRWFWIFLQISSPTQSYAKKSPKRAYLWCRNTWPNFFRNPNFFSFFDIKFWNLPLMVVSIWNSEKKSFQFRGRLRSKFSLKFNFNRKLSFLNFGRVNSN